MIPAQTLHRFTMPTGLLLLAGLAACSAGSTTSGFSDASTELTPNDAFVASGLEGGPILPATKEYTLRNVGTTAIGYSRSISASWLTVSGPATGTLGAGESLAIEVELGSLVTSFPTGLHAGEVRYAERVTGAVLSTIDVEVRIDPIGQGHSMTLTPPSGLIATGRVGGPFAPLAKTYRWMNNGSAPFQYRQVVTQPWVYSTLPDSGTVAAFSSVEFSVSLDSGTIHGFGEGTHTANVRLSDGNSNALHHDLAVQVVASSSGMTLSPSSGLFAAGPIGGPFTPDAKAYTWTNHAASGFPYSRTISQPWVLVSGPSSGTVPAGQSIQFSVSLDAARTAALTAGSHLAQVALRNGQGQTVQTIDVSVVVYSASSGTPTWSSPQQSAGARTIHVAPNGNDSTGDGSTGKPFRSIARGWQEIRSPSSDWLLLQRAGVWDEGLTIGKSGIDRDHPIVVGAYGSGARPMVHGGVQSNWGQTNANVTVRSLQSSPKGWSSGSPPRNGSGFSCWGGLNRDWVFEDCVAAGWDGDWLVDAPEYQTLGNHQNVTIRGCHAYESRNFMYLNRTDNMLVEHCIFDQTASGVSNGHAIYLQMYNGSTVIRDSSFTRIHAFNGINQRNTGAIIENNYGWRCIDFISCGGIATGNPHPYANGVRHTIRFNVCEEPRSNAITVLAAGKASLGVGPSVVEYNLITRGVPNLPNPAAMLLARNAESGIGVHDLTVRHNVVHDHPAGAIVLQSLNPTNSSNLEFHDNKIRVSAPSMFGSAHAVYESGSLPGAQFHSHDNMLFTVAVGQEQFYWNNIGLNFAAFMSRIGDPSAGSASVFSDPTPDFPDPARSGARYVDLVEGRSGSTHDDLIQRLRGQTMAGWDPRYSVTNLNAWIREGYAMPLEVTR
jgi:hypothetical protein